MNRLFTFACGMLLGSFAAMGQKPVETGPPDIVVHRTNPHVDESAPTAGGTGTLSPITNHGGPVMTTVNAYLIWYGNWNRSSGSDTLSGQALVRTFLSNVGGSSYYQINTTYGGVSGSVALKAETTDGYSLGNRLSDSDIRTIVVNAINSGKLGNPDPNGVYFVLTSSDVAKSGFCVRYCGWHTHASINGMDIKYSFVGNSNRCLSSCAAQTISPNGNAGVDGMISVVAHELEEANTDPDLNAWYDSSGAENADKCAWTFGSAQKQAANGAFYNMTLGGKNFLIQRNLDAQDNKCYVSYKGQQ